ncbi:tetratricopeptide repeat protein [Bacillus shivajii]|uniref:tetratricopeptide repeat protein n=1 Tax=Bacillus shivajii TaxID=1983719 RepID=UPI001CFBD6C9|nr:tetratricopeptide repeat protein [Bacillus shivajii]UCZ52636.1 tetratricopeptide repeat protein [Bacillus shivajii]
MRNTNVKEKRGQIIPFLQNGAYFYKKGIEAYQNRNIKHAINFIERAIRMEPDEPVFKCQLAIIFAEQGKYEEANVILEKLIEKGDESLSESFFFYANNLAHLGKLEEAKSHLNKYLELDPEGDFSEDAHSLLDMIDSEDILSEDSEEIEPLKQDELVIDYLNKGDFDWAEKEARGHLTEQPQDWDVYAYLAEALMNQGNLEEAQSILQNLLLKNEPNFLAQCLMCDLLNRTDDPQANTWVENVVHLRPMTEAHQYYLARTLYFLEQYQQAYKWFQKLHRSSSFQKPTAFYHQMAILAWKNGEKQTAEKLWERLKRLDRENEGMINDYVAAMENEADYPLPKDEWFYYKEQLMTQ